MLGRIHNPDQASNAIRAARIAGFDRVNADLMYGLPNQNPSKAVNDIQTAIDAGATHLSWYQLTIEPNTTFIVHHHSCQMKRSWQKLKLWDKVY